MNTFCSMRQALRWCSSTRSCSRHVHHGWCVVPVAPTSMRTRCGFIVCSSYWPVILGWMRSSSCRRRMLDGCWKTACTLLLKVPCGCVLRSLSPKTLSSRLHNLCWPWIGKSHWHSDPSSQQDDSWVAPAFFHESDAKSSVSPRR